MHSILLVGLCCASALPLVSGETDQGSNQYPGYFLRSLPNANISSVVYPEFVKNDVIKALSGYRHYRLLPAVFPKGMKYHFDGLATVMRLDFTDDGALTVRSRPYQSDAYRNYDHGCIFFGTGTGPTLGNHLCFQNPGVNLLPISGQLWLTIDTSSWGRMDPDTLETLPSKVNLSSFVLNAHPACDASKSVCYVQYPCPLHKSPLSKDVCVGELHATPGDMQVEELSRIELNTEKIIQHSHSPCVTQDFVVSKLDAFVARVPNLKNSGMLKTVKQGQDDQWLVMDRRTNQSRILHSPGHSFVNNHFWNCVQESDGTVVVEAVAATSDYLDNYFEYNLDKESTEWDKLFTDALRCTISTGAGSIKCEPLLPNSTSVFDYPTFNPYFKMDSQYRYFYAIARKEQDSRWFDQVIKVDRISRQIVQEWSQSGIFMTEADFIPASSSAQPEEEDNGFLVSVLYNSTSDTSSVAVMDAKTFELVQSYPLGYAVPFHAHGISCAPGLECWSNP